MKVKICVCGPRGQEEVYGIELTAESEEEDKTLNRFWLRGVKLNAFTPRRNNATSLQLTFADLIDK